MKSSTKMASEDKSETVSEKLEVKKTETGETQEDVNAVEKKHRGIPEAVFVDDVEAFMKKEEAETAEIVLKRLDEQHQKYKFMELNLLTKKRRLQSQVPDLNSSLEMVKLLKSKKEKGEVLHSRFLLSDQVHCNAEVQPTEKVCLWLGANVMLEYSIGEAESLLTKNLATATKNLEDIENDLGFLRDQYTTLEVNMARVYNWDVKRRQAQKNSQSQ